MATVIHCPSCSAPLAVTPEMVGKLIACPACDQQIQLAGKPPQPAANQPTTTSSKPIPRSTPDSVGLAEKLTAADKTAKKAKSTATALVAAMSVMTGLLIAGGIVGWRIWRAQRPQAVQAGLPPSARIRPAPANLTPSTPPSTEPAASDLPVTETAPALPTNDRETANALAAGAVPAGGPPIGPPPFGSFGPPPFALPPPPFAAPPSPFAAPPPGQIGGGNGASPTGARLPPPSPAKPKPKAKPKPAANPEDPLAALPPCCRLPALVSTSPEKLLTLACEPREKLEISIRTAAANVLPEAALCGGGFQPPKLDCGLCRRL